MGAADGVMAGLDHQAALFCKAKGFEGPFEAGVRLRERQIPA